MTKAARVGGAIYTSCKAGGAFSDGLRMRFFLRGPLQMPDSTLLILSLSKDAQRSCKLLLLLRQNRGGEAGVALGELLLQLLVERRNGAAGPLDHRAELLALREDHAHAFDIDIDDLVAVVPLGHEPIDLGGRSAAWTNDLALDECSGFAFR